MDTAADNLGMTIKKVWISTLDDKTRDDHTEMDGQEADADGMFTFPDGTKTEALGNVSNT
jgi:hypothetical protein